MLLRIVPSFAIGTSSNLLVLTKFLLYFFLRHFFKARHVQMPVAAKLNQLQDSFSSCRLPESRSRSCRELVHSHEKIITRDVFDKACGLDVQLPKV
jgi:hypothetical protein